MITATDYAKIVDLGIKAHLATKMPFWNFIDQLFNTMRIPEGARADHYQGIHAILWEKRDSLTFAVEPLGECGW